MKKITSLLTSLLCILFNIYSFSQASFTELTAGSNPFNGITIGQNDQIVPGDFDADGDVDFYSWDGSSSTFTFYKNNGSGVFSATTGTGNPFNAFTRKAPAYLSAAYAYVQDWDNDGDVDVFNTNYESSGDNRYFRNNGGTFTELTSGSNPFNGITIAQNDQIIPGDFDADGDIDFYSWDGSSSTFTFYKNNGSGAFTSTTGTGNPFDGFTRKAPAYNTASTVFVQDWDNDGDIDVFNTNYESSGDNRYFQMAGSPCSAPTAQATSAVFGSETNSTLTLSSFTAPAGGADGYTIYINSTNSFTAPSDGDEPTADTSWNGAGQQPIYFGTSASPNITVTGLDPETQYFFQVYAYNDCSGTETYETTGLNANDTTADGTAPNISSVSLDSSNGFIDVTFTEGVFDTGSGSGALETGDFALSITGGSATSPTVTSVTQTGGGSLAGGETTIRVNFTVTGTPNGSETLEVDITDGSSIFDAAGNAAVANQTSNNTATLNNNQISASINDPSVAEGDSGSTTLQFTVTLDNPAPVGGATIDYATSNGTATAGSDYTAASGTVSFSAGETSKTIDVTVAGDATVENDETLTITLSNPTGTSVTILDTNGTGTILNDDDPTPVFESLASAVIEEDTAITTTVLDVNANDGAGGATDVNVTYSLSGSDAGDFNINTNTGVLTFSSIPDWSSPGDANTDNIYKFTITANNGSSTAIQDVKIFVFPKSNPNGLEWQIQGNEILGEAAGDQSGYSVSLSIFLKCSQIFSGIRFRVLGYSRVLGL